MDTKTGVRAEQLVVPTNGWNVLAKRLAKPTDSAKVRRVGYVMLKMRATPCDEQTARGYAAMGSYWNAGAAEPYEHTAMPADDVENTLAQWRKDVEAAGLALIRAA